MEQRKPLSEAIGPLVLAAAIILVLLWATAAKAQNGPNALVPCVDCDDVELWLKAATIAAMEARVDRENQIPDDWGQDDDDPWGGDDGGWDGGASDDDDGGCGGCGCGSSGDDDDDDDSDSVAAGGDDDDDDDDDASAEDGGDDDFGGDDDDDDDVTDDDDGGGDEDDDHSGTNNQEKGIDEDDIVKTDGESLFVLANGVFYVLDAQPAWSTSVIGSLPVPGRAIGMHFFGNTVVTMTDVGGWDLPKEWIEAIGFAVDGPVLKITVIDISDLTAPAVIRERWAEGTVAGSRRVDSRIHIVLHTDKNGPDVEYALDPYSYPDRESFEQAVEDLKAWNRERIQDGTPADWLPMGFVAEGGAKAGGPEFLTACDELLHPETPRGGDVLSVITLNFDGQDDTQESVGVLASGLAVYAAKERLYVAGTVEGARDLFGRDPAVYPDTSGIHMFDIASEPGRAVYTASAEIPGFVLNQFSMSEHEGYLRVAATYGDANVYIASAVSIFDVTSGVLAPSGSVGGIAPGEELYTARFMGDRGYLVTYPAPGGTPDDPWDEEEDPWDEEDPPPPDDGDDCGACDPLFTLDLADPENPVVVGELVIPGFSTYLHPLGDDHLLAIGEGGDEFGANGGVALAIYDISDFANPTQTHLVDLGAEGITSDAKLEHHAFFYWEPLELLSIPVRTDEWFADGGNGRPFAGFATFDVSPEDGFEFIRGIEHTAFGDGALTNPRRTVYIEDNLYTLSDGGVVVTDLEFWADVAMVPLN
ncbi:beta-propeller domain-containing protein [bacterium]|nr:beta-propeller domain-containing protein [bacterium]